MLPSLESWRHIVVVRTVDGEPHAPVSRIEVRAAQRRTPVDPRGPSSRVVAPSSAPPGGRR
jgi:hypothetical protein